MNQDTKIELEAYLAGDSEVPAPVASAPADAEKAEKPLKAVPDQPASSGGSIGQWFRGLGTWGNLGIALFILIVLWMAIVPVSSGGYTRLELLWATLRGNTRLNTGAPAPETIEQKIAHEADGIGSSIGHNITNFEHWVGHL